MASWRDEYIQALKDRDEREKASCQRIEGEYIEAYTALLDQLSVLEAEKAAFKPTNDTTPKDSNVPAGQSTPVEGNPQLKADLTEALRSNGQLQTRIKAAETELTKLRTKTKADAKTMETLTKQNAILTQKIKDRDEELRGKTKHYHDVQDEMISLNLQLNIAEQKAKKLAVDNQELVDRWMARKGKEADEMNDTLHDR